LTLLPRQKRAATIPASRASASPAPRDQRDSGRVRVAAWRETPYFSDAERAGLALTEALTRIADRPEPVPYAIWDAAAEHFDETQLGALVLDIATVNVWNRLNIATRQVVGEQSW
jgi:alkylhydroperoxidase family enzyme